MKFELKKSDKNGEFYFTLRNNSDNVIITSEGYKQKSSAKKGIQSLMKNGAAGNIDLKVGVTSGKPFFNVKATNGQVVGKSRVFVTEQERDASVEELKANITNAIIIEEV
jgi:uncharacterized protein YegP (UPF0339 family)